MNDLKADIVVVGSGSAGLSAALAAAERGRTVKVLEKTAEVGGAIKGGNGLFAVGTRMQRDRQISLTRARAFQLMMEHTQWRVDAQLVSAYINKSADTIEWLEKLGVSFSDVVAYYQGAEYTWHFRDRDSPRITDVLHQQAIKAGVKFQVETRACKLLLDNGRVRGVQAEPKASSRIEVDAQSVILTTGGFGGNHEWISKKTGFTWGKDLFSFSFPENSGDGIRMAQQAGAAGSEMMMETFVSLPEPYWGPGGTAFELGAFRQPNLMVNLQGERFMNEEIMRHPSFAANAVHRQTNGCAFMIFDEATNRHYEKDGFDFVLSKLPITKSENLAGIITKAVQEGYQHLFMADTLDALATSMGVDPARFRETLEEYNTACANGLDPRFHRSPGLLRPVKQPKFYAARFFNGGYGSLGGILTDHRLRVLSRDHQVIPGLYAAGRDANAIYGGTYPFLVSGNSSSFCYNSGRMAGEHASDYVKQLRH